MLQVFIAKDFEQMSQAAADFLLKKMREATIERKENFNLGLATGSSPKRLFELMIERQREFNASKIRAWALDEYVGLPGNSVIERESHNGSFSRFLAENLLNKLSPSFSSCFIPKGNEINQRKLIEELDKSLGKGEAEMQGKNEGKAVIISRNSQSKYLNWIKSDLMDSFLDSIKQAKGIDCWVLGVGENGHLAFHEAGISLENEMLLVKLDSNTQENAVKDRRFKNIRECPKFGLSMGAKGVFDNSKCIILLASGKRKTKAIADSLLKQVSDECPISGLQEASKKGKEVVYFLDETAAQGILGKEKELKEKGFKAIDLRN